MIVNVDIDGLLKIVILTLHVLQKAKLYLLNATDQKNILRSNLIELLLSCIK